MANLRASFGALVVASAAMLVAGCFGIDGCCAASPGDDADSAPEADAGSPAPASDAVPSVDACSGCARPSTALAFDGVDDYVDCGDMSAFDGLVTGATWEFWFYWPGPGSAGGPIVAKYNEGVAGGSSFIVSGEEAIGDGTLVYAVGLQVSNGGGSGGCGAEIYTPGWHFVAFTWAPGTVLRGYIDGEPDAGNCGGSDTMAPSNSPLRVGGLPAGGFGGYADYVAGTIDELRIWDHYRSGVDIGLDMYADLDGTEPGLFLYLDFDEGADQFARDRAANEVECVLGGAAPTQASDPVWVPGVDP